jgi:hypothetical protein
MAAEIAGLAGTPSPQVLSVQGVPGGVPIPVSGGGGGSTPSTATAVTSVPGTVALTTLLVANPSRKGATFYNNGNTPWFIKLGAGANTSTSFTLRLEKSSYYEVPYNYVGVITGLQAVANGNLLVTELT